MASSSSPLGGVTSSEVAAAAPEEATLLALPLEALAMLGAEKAVDSDCEDFDWEEPAPKALPREALDQLGSEKVRVSIAELDSLSSATSSTQPGVTWAESAEATPDADGSSSDAETEVPSMRSQVHSSESTPMSSAVPSLDSLPNIEDLGFESLEEDHEDVPSDAE